MIYDEKFYDLQGAGSYKSAKIILDFLWHYYKPKSVIDFGCGKGTWLFAAAQMGADKLKGYDGEWVKDLIGSPKIDFSVADLENIEFLDQKYDLAISVEVAEHLSKSAGQRLIHNLCKASDVVLFSAAALAQGGVNHINEQWQSYWINLFKENDFLCFDAIRPQVWNDENVEWWYRQNIFLFVKAGISKNTLDLDILGKIQYPIYNVAHPRSFEYRIDQILKLESMVRAKDARIASFEAAVKEKDNNLITSPRGKIQVSQKLGRANDFRVIAILAVYNEERFIRGCLENLARHGIQVYLIDNCSTDSTVSIAKEHSNVIGIETFPRDGVYRWRPILQRKEALAEVLEADWFMHIDADERHLPPFSGTTLAEALRKTGEQGWNAVNFHEYSFVPTAEHPDHDHPDFEKTMKWYYAHEPRFPWRLNAWKKQPARVDIASSGGHQVKFPALKLCPENFHMKHYVFLSKAHALQKYKAKQYDEKELQEGWHGWRAQLVAEAIDLPREATLNEYISDDRLDPTRPWKSEWLECAIESHKKKVFGISSTTALPFDQYQRYRIVSDIINKYRRGSERFKILDVGAGFEENLKKFLPEDDVYCQDKDYPESFSQKENFISGDFISLELDDTYDFVISIDCYEHIPPSGRQLYVNKLIAASRTATIIAAPFDTEGVREMETLASELYRMTHGTSYRWLEEHIQNGLPSLDYTLEMVRKLGFKTLVVPNGYLARWFQMISLYLLSVDREEFIAILQNLWEFYNRNFYPFDNKAPAYRHVLIIDKTNKMEMPSFDALVSTRSEAGDDFKFKEKLLHNYFDQIKYLLQKTFQEKVEMQGAVISRLEAAMAQKDADLAKRAAHIARLDSAMAEKDADIAKRAAHIVHLDSVIARLEGEHHRKDEFLNNLYSSHGWRVLSKYYRMRDKMLPQNAKRRVIAKLVFHSLAGIARRCFRRLKSEDPSVPGPGMRPSEVSEFTKISFEKCDEPLVSIIIPVHNQWKATYGCLLSILRNTGDVPYEIIIADDLSTDKTVKLEGFVKNINIIRNTENLGFLKNCNNAARLAGGKYLLFLNNDTQVREGWLRHMLDLIENDSRIGMVGSKLVFPDGRLQEAGGIIWNDASGWNFGRSDDPTKAEYNYVKEADYVSGASMMVRKDLWVEIGGFDERFAPCYYEDADLAFEVRKRGYKVIYQPRSVVVHFEGVSHGTDENSGIKRYQVVNRKKFIEKWKAELGKDHLANAGDVFWARDRSRNKKTILVVDHYVPHYDRDAGSRLMFHYLKFLRECGFNVKFIGHNFFRHEPYTTTLEQMGIEVLVGSWYADNWREWIKSNAKYLDYALLSRPHIAMNYIDFIRESTQAKILYLPIDLVFLREMRRYEIEKDETVLKASEHWKRIEFDLIRKSDVVLTLSSIEKEIIRESFPAKEVGILPIFIYSEFPDGTPKFSERRDIMFIGGFGHPPNADGVNWFVKSVFPRVLESSPGVRFHIAGSNMPEAIRSMRSRNITLRENISDVELEDLYGKSRLVVVPLRYGAGIKGKVIEAMYHGVPVVSTGIGVEGLEGIRSIIEPTDDEAGFAERIIELYGNEDMWNRVSQDVVAYVRANNSADAVRERFIRFFDGKPGGSASRT